MACPSCFLFGFLYTLLSQWVFLPWEMLVAFPKESQLQHSCYPALINYKVIAGYFLVSVIHRILTWTAGSLTCACDHSYACKFREIIIAEGNIMTLASGLVVLCLELTRPEAFPPASVRRAGECISAALLCSCTCDCHSPAVG